MADEETQAVHDDPREWAPMRVYRGRRSFEIEDPIIEPFWSGTRVLAHVGVRTEAEPPVEVAMIEELGADLALELPALADAVGRATVAVDAVVDGVVSRQVTLDGVGAAAIPEVRARPIELFVRNSADFDVVARGAIESVAAAEPKDGFIAVDLLRVDGTPLLDVPLLERKRLLESVIAPDDVVRVSAHVRPPVETWIATWKSMGLRGGILKAANSRYHPNDDTTEWRVVERIGRSR